MLASVPESSAIAFVAVLSICWRILQMEQYQKRVAELTAAGESWATVKVSMSQWTKEEYVNAPILAQAKKS